MSKSATTRRGGRLGPPLAPALKRQHQGLDQCLLLLHRVLDRPVRLQDVGRRAFTWGVAEPLAVASASGTTWRWSMSAGSLS
eukprot:3573626-Alexandrium_andersonii.AAC.1